MRCCWKKMPATDISGVAPDSDIYYRFLVVNTGDTVLTDINVTDVPDVGTSACEFTNPLNIGGATACVVGPITGEHADGTVTNTATASGTSLTDPIDSLPSTASYTVAPTRPNLSATKTNSVSGTATEAVPFTWSIQVGNSAGTAVFADGQTILADPLPFTASDQVLGPTAGGGTTGAEYLDCAITAGTVKCTASGGSVSIPAGGTITVSFEVTPGAVGEVTNTVTVDPLNAVIESDESNNTGSDTVMVSPGTPLITVAKLADVETVDAASD